MYFWGLLHGLKNTFWEGREGESGGGGLSSALARGFKEQYPRR